MHPFTDITISLGTGKTFSLYGRLAIDLFICENGCYQIPSSKYFFWDFLGFFFVIVSVLSFLSLFRTKFSEKVNNK